MRRTHSSILALLSALALTPPALAQTSSPPAAQDDSGTMKRSDKPMRQVLEKLMELGAKPLGTQSVEETRKGPTPADAVKALLKDEGKDPDALAAAVKVDKKDLTY